ncbi:MAG: TolC family protein [Planctomycetota bacterium]|nr:TolC family protein [Planctomycetota bacterium]
MILQWTGWSLCAAAAAVLAGCPGPVRRADEIGRFQAYNKSQASGLGVRADEALSMARCEQVALANSLDLRVRQMALGLQDDQVRLALTGAMPHANLQYADGTRSNENLGSFAGAPPAKMGDRHEKDLGIQAVLPVLDFGLTYYSWQIAKDRRAQGQFLLARAEQLLRRDVRVAYARHAGSIRQQRLAETAYAAGVKVLEVARSLQQEKMTAGADTALIEAAVAQAALDLSLTKQRVEQTHMALTQLMSLSPGAQFRIDESPMALPVAPNAATARAFEDRALRTRPELAVQDLERRASASSVLREAAGFFPRLDLTAGLNWTSSSLVVNPAFFTGGFLVSHALLDGGATVIRTQQAQKASDIEKERSLLLSLGILYDVQMRVLAVRDAEATVTAARALERSRAIALNRIVSLYQEGLEDVSGAARSLGELTVQATTLDRAMTEYQAAWHELEAAVLPERPVAAVASRPASRPTRDIEPWPARPVLKQGTRP